MNFKDFFEAGTVGGPMGGPGVSGALGMNPMKVVKPAGPVAPGVNPAKIMANPVPASPFSPGTKRPVEPIPGGSFGGGGFKSRYMKKK